MFCFVHCKVQLDTSNFLIWYNKNAFCEKLCLLNKWTRFNSFSLQLLTRVWPWVCQLFKVCQHEFANFSLSCEGRLSLSCEGRLRQVKKSSATQFSFFKYCFPVIHVFYVAFFQLWHSSTIGPPIVCEFVDASHLQSLDLNQPLRRSAKRLAAISKTFLYRALQNSNVKWPIWNLGSLTRRRRLTRKSQNKSFT